MVGNRKRRNVVKYVVSREINDEICGVLRDRLHVTDSFIERLGLESELEGHEGCVNCLEWSDSGRFLASGSDDTNIILWDPFHKKLLAIYPTLHEGNIFSVKFLPQTNDSKIISGAADHKIHALDALTKDTYYVCRCSGNRIKRLATSPDSPNLFWSASEDGIIRETDLRLPHTCTSQARNIVINLRNHQKFAEGKCLAINPLRPEMLAVGSNDPYVRLYDRRMIKITTKDKSSEWYDRMVKEHTSTRYTAADLEIPWEGTDNLVGGCVQYFVPGHLQVRNGYKRPKYTTITYITFSPDGRHLLANLGSEQVYLFDVTMQNAFQTFSIPKNEAVNGCTSTCSHVASNFNYSKSKGKDALPELINQLKQSANKYFNQKNYQKAIRLYNEAIGRFSSSSVLYGNRAAAYMKRAWRGDMYAALKDCRMALELDPDYMKAFFRLARCFYELKRNEEARDCLNQFKLKFTRQAEDQACRALEKDIESAFKKIHEKARRGAQNEPRIARSVHVSFHLDGIYVADTNLDLQVSKAEKLWRSNASDFEQRFCGHCNATTDIKEANFFGRDGRYIVAGSDDGSIFFWDRFTENNIKILEGDSSVVNCLQPHPNYCLLASSGIDPIVRLWSPMPEEGWMNERVVEDVDAAAENNNKRMKKDFLDMMIGHWSNASEDSNAEDRNYACRPS